MSIGVNKTLRSYISYQAIYNKTYYGLALDKLSAFHGGNFSTCKTYS
ncbi:hypothetical protein [Moellerella wisconsensis]